MEGFPLSRILKYAYRLLTYYFRNNAIVVELQYQKIRNIITKIMIIYHDDGCWSSSYMHMYRWAKDNGNIHVAVAYYIVIVGL